MHSEADSVCTRGGVGVRDSGPITVHGTPITKIPAISSYVQQVSMVVLSSDSGSEEERKGSGHLKVVCLRWWHYLNRGH